MKLLTKIILLVITIGVFYLGLTFFDVSLKNPFGIKSKDTIHHIVLEEMRTLGKLELANFSFKDIVEQELKRDYLPNPKAILVVYGEATGCIDLTTISIKDIEVDGDSIFLKIPEPELCYYKIDHSKSHIYDASYAFMNEKLLFEEAYKSAETKIKESALQSGILKSTSDNASLVLIPLLEKITEKKVRLK